MNSFGFTDRTGEGLTMSIHVFHDKILQSGTNTIMIDEDVIKTFKKTLNDLQTKPEAFKFIFDQVELNALLSADV